MRLRLLLLTAFTSCLLLTILALTVVPLVQSKVKEQYDETLRSQVMEIAGYILENSPTDTEAATFVAGVDTNPDTVIGVETPSGAAIGRDGNAVAKRWPGFQQILEEQPRSALGTLYPRYYQTAGGDRVASLGVFTGTKDWVIEGTVTHLVIDSAQRNRWLLIAGMSVLALALSLFVADLLARRITRPIRAAVTAAAAIGSGHLRVAVPTVGPPEVVELGSTLNQLAGRIERLLAGERERAANLSHRLRTPMTVMALETERLERDLHERPDQLRLVRNSIRALEQGLDEIIRESQRTRRDGVVEECDAVAVVRTHVEFWSPMAAAQSRLVDVDIPEGPLLVPLDSAQLGVAFDALISNIFRHTNPGTGYSVRMERAQRDIVVTFRDADEYPAQPSVPWLAGGSTGLGLKVAKATIEDAGGTLTTTNASNHGFTAVVRLKLCDTYPERTSS